MGEYDYTYIVSRQDGADGYGLWRFRPDGDELLEAVDVADATLSAGTTLTNIGDFILAWQCDKGTDGADDTYPYQLLSFDPTAANPLGGTPVQKGTWPKWKFWGSVKDFGNPDGAKKDFQDFSTLMLLPMSDFLLNFIPSAGRGTFRLWNFDPGQTDPLPSTPYFPQGSFESIELGHELLPISGFVLDRVAADSSYRLWSFDPEEKICLAKPVIAEGTWDDIGPDHQLVVIGQTVLDWVPGDDSYRLWGFDANAERPLVGPLREGTLPSAFTAKTALATIQQRATAAVDDAKPGTIEFMRTKIKHVVHYMIENRAFDHICGWMYETGAENIKFVGPDHPFQGASTELWNWDSQKKEKVFLSKYHDGVLGTDYNLDLPVQDPYHDNSDVLRQLFSPESPGYFERAKPDMAGFVWNNGAHNVMQTYSAEQVPVLNGLGKHFAVSDEWFCSMPGGTDVNRAFSLTGNALKQLNNFQNGTEYKLWPQIPHRPSIFKILWANGITDWKIYNSVEWMDFVFTYQLFCEGQIPTVDADVSKHVTDYDNFLADAKAGMLPAFSYVEPIWIAKTGTNSYHPGEDIIPGEVRVNEIYEALKASPKWDETLLVITFDEHGGIYDHVPPPYAENPYPNDCEDGFRYDLMGVRIPTMLVSPWVNENTVFRSTTDVSYDSTSFLASLLTWFGVPKSRWGLGQRTNHAPTFEGVLCRDTPRTDFPTFEPAYDKNYPPTGDTNTTAPVHDLHRMMVPRLLHAKLGDKVSPAEIQRRADHINQNATDTASLHKLITEQLDK
jgi:phospholipase C